MPSVSKYMAVSNSGRIIRALFTGRVRDGSCVIGRFGDIMRYTGRVSKLITF